MARMAVLDKEHPMKGVMLCFTSILTEKRDELIHIAREMGATPQFDLTADTTHLVVGNTNTEKYKFVARARNDVVVLKPEWVEAVRLSWMQGEDTDIRALEVQYKYPTFAGLAICITGFEDMAFRTYMQNTVLENGAEFRKDLTKSVTHLIARGTEGAKYRFATQWDIKVVSLKWFTDSLERGMSLEEHLYHPLVPPAEQGGGAWDRSLPEARGQAEKERTAANENTSIPRPRKLRRIASAKLVDQNEGIWGDIMGAGFPNHEPKAPRTVDLKHGDSTNTGPVAVVQEAKSFASETTFSSEAPQARQQLAGSTTSANGFLHESYFYIHGFAPKRVGILRHHLQFNGAQLVDSLGEFSRPSIPKTGKGLYIIVPYRTPRSEIPSTDDMAFECEVVTDMWLERCLDSRSLVAPESHVASTPFPKFPIPGFAGMRICSTGFVRIDLLHIGRLVDLMGATYDEILTPQASVLICNDPQTASQEKLRHTSEWGVPTVSGDWFWISIQTGQKKPFEPYLVRSPSLRVGSGEMRPNAVRAERNRHQEQVEKALPEKPSSVEATNDGRADKRSSGRSEKKRTVSFLGDGFSTEDYADPPKPSVPESRPSSPAVQPPPKSTTEESTTNRAPLDHSTSSLAAPSALDIAMSGLLQQARAAKSRSQPENTTITNDDGSYPSRRKRKPLLGRAPSQSSTRMLDSAGAVASRASSIDTLNDDGVGSALESAHPTRDNSMSRTNSRTEQSLSSMFSAGKLDYLADRLPAPFEDEDEENQEPPPMTQLDYEDADAAAMRAEFLIRAGKLPRKKNQANGSSMPVGEARELEDIGWASGRRTRKTTAKIDDGM